MKIAVSSTGRDLDSQVDPRFGRCAYILFVDTDTFSVEAHENENAALSGGAGIQTASMVASKGIRALLTGNCGPKAMQVFDAEGIQVFTGLAGTVRGVVERFKAGSLAPSKEATVSEKGGMPSKRTSNAGPTAGTVPGRGLGGGRGMGCGRGRGGGQGRGRRQS